MTVGVRARKAGVERPAELPRPGEGAGWDWGDVVRERPGKKGVLQMHRGGLGPRPESCLEAGGVGGRTGFPAERASSDQVRSQRFLSPARQGWGLAREGRWRWPGRRNSFHFPAGCGEQVPGLRELGCQDAAGRDQDCRSNFVGLSRETEAGEGLMESEADLGLEMLPRGIYSALQ